MDDHDYSPEVQVDYFRCVEQQHTALTNFPRNPLSPSAPLLAISSRFGYLLYPVQSTLHIYPLARLRRDTDSLSEGHVESIHVDLAAQGVTDILGISLLEDDTAVLLHAQGDRGGVFLLSLAGLVDREMAWMAGVELSDGITIKRIAVGGNSTVAMVEDGGAVNLCELQMGEQVEGRYIHGLGEGGGLCVAVSPGGELVAVGVESGSIYLYDAGSLEKKGEIVVVESGWVPFGVNFITEEDVLVAYVKDSIYYYIVWTIAENEGKEGALLAKKRSMLGELCYPAQSLAPWEDEGEGDEKRPQKDSSTPFVFCSPIPGWPMCVVSSSCSSDIEVIAKEKDGDGWEIWQFDEGKTAVLPMGEADTDSKPLGIGLDLTDIHQIDAIDPSAPKINPMPRLIALTTEATLVPFALIDDRSGASCDAIKKPQAFPLIPKFTRPIQNVNLHEETPKVDESNIPEKNESRSLDEADTSTGNSGALAEKSESVPSFGFKAENVPSFAMMSRQPGFAGANIFAELSITERETVPNVPKFSFEPQIRKQCNESSSSEEESDGGANDSIEDDSRFTGSVARTDEDGTERSSILSANAETSFRPERLQFSGAEKFLSKFEFVDISNKHQPNEESDPFSPSTKPQPFGFKGASPPQGRATSTSNSLAPISLPAYPMHPSFEEVSAAVSTGKPQDLIRSVLLEMKEELDYNREAQCVMTRRTQAVGEVLMPRVDSVKEKLSVILEDIREHFRKETDLRRDVGDSLSEVTARSKEFETNCLEFRIREEEGFSRDIQPEDKLIDEQISRKELAVTKSVAEIEGRLHSERVSRDCPGSQVENIQRIYSSLSLQGLRIRRVCGLLATLAARVEGLENSGRRSDLGLSVARLEKLSRSETARSVRRNSESLASTLVEPGSGTRARTPRGRNEMDNMVRVPELAEGEFSASKEVLSTLRRLAMRGGRANIEARSSKTLFERKNSIAQNKLQTSDNEARSEYKGSDLQLGTEEEYSVSETVAIPAQPAAFGNASEFQGIGHRDFRPLQGSLMPVMETQTELGVRSVAAGTDHTLERSTRAKSNDSAAMTANPVFPFTRERDTATRHIVRGDVAVDSSRAGRETPVRFSEVCGEPLRPGFGLLESSGTERAPKHPDDKTNTALVSAQLAGNGLFAFPAPDHPQLTSQTPPHAKTAHAINRKTPLSLDKSEVITVAGTGQKDGEFATGPSASPPRDDFEKSAVQPSHELRKRGFSASLPPENNVKGGLHGRLPPKRREEAVPIVSLPPLSASIAGAGGIKTPTDLKSGYQAAGIPPEEGSAPGTPSNSHRNSRDTTGSLGVSPPEKLGGRDSLTSFSHSASTQDKHESLQEGMKGEGGPGSAIPLQRSSLQGGSQPSGTGDGDKVHSSSVGTNIASSPSAIGKPGGTSAFGSNGEAVPQFGSSMPGGILGSQSQREPSGATSITEREEFSSDDSDVGRKNDEQEVSGMDTSVMQSETSKGFGTATASITGSGQSESMGIFGLAQAQNSLQPGFGQTAQGSVSLTSNGPFGGSQEAQNFKGIFGGGDSSSSRGFGFLATSSSTSAQGGSGEGFGAKFGSSSQFGQQSPIGGGSVFGAAGPSGGSAQFGMNSPFGGNNSFAGSQFGAGFGETSQLGAGSPFNNLAGGGSSGFGSTAPVFGKGMSSATFGEVSGFGPSQSGHGSFGGSNSFGSSNVTPFGAVGGSGFGGQSGSGSGFAALAGSHGFGGSGGSAFGNSAVPVFGNDNRPPAFTSPAFSERRA